MNTNRSHKLLYVTDWEFPCDEPFMREVYAKRWQNHGNDVVWVMRGDTDEITRERWNGSPVYQLSSAYDPMKALTRRIFSGGDELQHIYEREGPFDVVQVRNDIPMAANVTNLMRDVDTPTVFRHTHLKAEELSMGYRDRVSGYSMADYAKGHVGKHVRNHLMGSFDRIYSISSAMSDYLHQSGITTPVMNLPMGADTTLNPKYIDPDPFLQEWGLHGHNYLVYIGTMSPFRRLEFLFSVLEHLQEDHPDVKLVFVGGRKKKNRDRLRRLSREAGVEKDVIFTGWVEKSTVNRAVVGASVGVSPLPPNKVLRTNSPTKVLEYLNLETPVVVNRTPEQQRFIEKSDGGIAVPYEPKAFADAVSNFLLNTDIRRESGESGRAYVKANRSYDVLYRRAKQYYNELLRD